MREFTSKEGNSPAVRAADAVVGTALDVMLPDTGPMGSGVVTSPQSSGNAALDAALKDPAAQKGVALAVAGAAGVGMEGGLVIGFFLGAGTFALLSALWPKRKR